MVKTPAAARPVARANPPQTRLLTLAWVAGAVLLFEAAVRTGLAWYEGGLGQYGGLLAWLQIYAVGLLYDLAVLTWFLVPFFLLAWVCPRSARGRRWHAILATIMYAALIGALVFQGLAEFVFWNEFAARFNFIAVDYLVYTREVVGNIQQSYPVVPLLLGVAATTALLLGLTLPGFWRVASAPAPTGRTRTQIFLLGLLLPLAAYAGLDETPHRWIDGAAARELAGNGTYSLFRAFRNNQLDYRQYYATRPAAEVADELREELSEAHAWFEPLESSRWNSYDGHADDVIARQVPALGPRRPFNVVMISIESLGSDYVDAFDGKRGLTPNLDAIAGESLIFTNLYATGLRTVRGLEALTLSVPPTPGRAVPMRPQNTELQTLGGIFMDQGYEALYFYGGYAWFDNMQNFFGGNGYSVIDRRSIAEEEISHETIWGVADEDLFRLTLGELDQRAKGERPFFAHVMTTSNHRPYTYPDGRVSIPPHSGRNGAVQYTDWAIGQFMAEAKKRSWYDNTVFVLVADHTSHGRGRIDLPPENYRIPLIIHAPALVNPGRIDTIASQIDVAPTLLSLLNIGYQSHFFGQDILHEAQYHPRAFMANYLTVGYMEDGRIVELGPRQSVRVLDVQSGRELSLEEPKNRHLVGEAIAYYQSASDYIEGGTIEAFHNGSGGLAEHTQVMPDTY